MKAGIASKLEEYLAALPDERREVVARVRAMVLANLPEGYRETFASASRSSAA